MPLEIFTEVNVMWIQGGVNVLCLAVDASMFVILVRKLRCRSNSADNEYELLLSSELTVYAFYISGISWHISRVCWMIILPASIHFDGAITEAELCRVLTMSRMTIGALNQIALENVLMNRVYCAFLNTTAQLSKCTNYGIRIFSLIVWSVMLIYFVIFKLPQVLAAEEETMTFSPNGDCVSPDTMAVNCLMILSISGTLGIIGLFLFKLYRFRTNLYSNPLGVDLLGDDFLLKVIKKHSVILFWVTIKSIVLTVLYIVLNQYIGIIAPVIDRTANTVAIFLSFSFNSKWYKSCGCDKCADALFNLIICCLRRLRKEECQCDTPEENANNLQMTVELATVSADNAEDKNVAVNGQNQDIQEQQQQQPSKPPTSPMSPIECVENRGHRQRSLSQGIDQMMKNEALSLSREPSHEHSLSIKSGHSRNVTSGMLKDRFGRNNSVRDLGTNEIDKEEDIQCHGEMNISKSSDGQGIAGIEDFVQEQSTSLCGPSTSLDSAFSTRF